MLFSSFLEAILSRPWPNSTVFLLSGSAMGGTQFPPLLTIIFFSFPFPVSFFSLVSENMLSQNPYGTLFDSKSLSPLFPRFWNFHVFYSEPSSFLFGLDRREPA